MDVVFTYADRIIVMAAGSLIAQGTPEEIKHNQAVREVYLGSTQIAARELHMSQTASAKSESSAQITQESGA